MTPPDPEIFNIRLESAAWNLRNLEGVLRIIQARAEHVRGLHQKMSDDRNQISESLRVLNDHFGRLNELASADNPRIRAIQREVDSAQEEFKDLARLIDDARSRATQIFCLQTDPTLLGERAQEFAQKLETSTEDLARLGLSASAAGSWVTLKALGGVWIEYLDYLAGLCLRYEGLEQAICEIGDALIQELRRTAGVGALAVPGRDSASANRPNLVFLSFPEWTVWALPLAAHELWHVAANQATFRGKFQNFLKQRQMVEKVPFDEEKDELIQDCLADAFATYAMGPAYACAALLLALDPLSSHDQERAHAILSVLDSANGRELTNAHQLMHEKLARMWARATNHAGQNLSLPDARVARWTTALVDYLAQPHWPVNLKFPVERWQQIHLSWIPALLHDGKVEGDLKGKSLRLALNAAWCARLERPDRQFSDIGSNCYALCMSIIKTSPVDAPLSESTGFWPPPYRLSNHE